MVLFPDPKLNFPPIVEFIKSTILASFPVATIFPLTPLSFFILIFEKPEPRFMFPKILPPFILIMELFPFDTKSFPISPLIFISLSPKPKFTLPVIIALSPKFKLSFPVPNIISPFTPVFSPEIVRLLFPDPRSIFPENMEEVKYKVSFPIPVDNVPSILELLRLIVLSPEPRFILFFIILLVNVNVSFPVPVTNVPFNKPLSITTSLFPLLKLKLLLAVVFEINNLLLLLPKINCPV